ncbi:MAG: hypothetical protein WDN28_19320 [Chthoniobacter sp.]
MNDRTQWIVRSLDLRPQASNHVRQRVVHHLIGNIRFSKLEAVFQDGQLGSMLPQPAGEVLGILPKALDEHILDMAGVMICGRSACSRPSRTRTWFTLSISSVTRKKRKLVSPKVAIRRCGATITCVLSIAYWIVSSLSIKRRNLRGVERRATVSFAGVSRRTFTIPRTAA